MRKVMPRQNNKKKTPKKPVFVGLSSSEIDSVKGVLILLVVLGHSPLQYVIPHLKQIIYSFHMHSFLFIPFLFPSKQFSVQYCSDRAIRYLSPYVVFVVACCILYFSLYIPLEESISWLQDVAIGLVVGNALPLKKACGFQIYWFLPALFTLNIFRSLYTRFSRSGKIIILILLLCLHPFLGLLPRVAKDFIPFGLHIAAYLFPLAVFAGFVWNRLFPQYRPAAKTAVCSALTVCLIIMVQAGSNVRLGALNVYGYNKVFSMLLHDIIPLLAFISLLGCASYFARIPLLSYMGKHSLGIFVSHQLFMHGLVQISKLIFFTADIFIVRFITGCIIIICSIVLSVYLAKVIYANVLIKGLVFPRSSSDWLHIKNR